MKFKLSLHNFNELVHFATCVVWSSTEEIYSCGEDHLLICWHLERGTTRPTIITKFPADFYPTDMQWHPRPVQTTATSARKQSLDVLLITTTDGKFYLINKNGRIEKSVDAHKGATLFGKWNHDGSAILTAGEDGLLKIWSRSGMLCSTVTKGTEPCLTSAWSPKSSTILYSHGTQLLLQSLNSNSKPYKWHAHDGLILTVSWNHSHGLIISGGEDCRFKIWDTFGNQLYCSSVGDHPITTISWCYSGTYFAVGSFNMIRLCDKTGWSHSLEKMNSGSIYCIAWSNDSSQVAMACGSGAILSAHVIDRRLEWNNYEATLVLRKSIEVREVGNERRETLQISSRVVQLEFGFNHLVVITPNQCHVYSVTNWNTPTIFDLKHGSVSAVILADKHFLLVKSNIITLYSYQGCLLGVPRWKGMTQELLYPRCISLCSDYLIIRNQNNEKLLHVLDVSNSKLITEGQSYLHLHNIVQLALNHISNVTDRQLALIDVNRDLFLIFIRTSGFGQVCKIAAMAQSICWATDGNVLAAMLDATLSVWLCPSCVHHSDHKIARRTRIDKVNSEFGKQPNIVSVHNGTVTVRRGDGALVAASFYTLFTSLQQYIIRAKWKDALSLCRIAQNEILWTCMAIMAIDSKELNVAEEAYAAIGKFDKVDYIQYIKMLSSEIEKLARMALLAGNSSTAEGILLQNGLITEAIRTNIEIYNWNRALELTIRHKKHMAELLYARENYLRIIDKKEINHNYLTLTTNLKTQGEQFESDHEDVKTRSS